LVLKYQNRFENLAQDLQDIDKSTDNIVCKFPSIFVTGVADLIPFTILLDRLVKNEYEIKVLSSTQIKIQPKTCIKYIYTLIVKELQARNIYIYKMKEERSFKFKKCTSIYQFRKIKTKYK